MFKKAYCFDDVLMVPSFTTTRNRTSEYINTTSFNLKLPIISSNMDTVTEVAMTKAMDNADAIGCLHRFCSIEDNLKMFAESCTQWNSPFVSFGLGDKELERFEALLHAGANKFCLDVAHAASISVVEQVRKIRELQGYDGFHLMVGNFATKDTYFEFIERLGNNHGVDSVKVGIGGGSACLTRVVTGCGLPTLASILDFNGSGIHVVADGGIRSSDDFAKAIAAGADAVMIGGLLAGTDESPGEVQFTEWEIIPGKLTPDFEKGERRNTDSVFTWVEKPSSGVKKYRGSASLESYEVQGKVASHRVPEGASFLTPYKGPVKDVLQQLEAGLRSAMSYVGATTIQEFQDNTEFVEISSNALRESGAHGKH